MAVVRPGATLAARRLRLVTVPALGLTWLGLGMADALGVAVGLAVYAGAGLLVVALGLVAATRLGRARGLLPAGVVLAVAAVVASGCSARRSPRRPGRAGVRPPGRLHLGRRVPGRRRPPRRRRPPGRPHRPRAHL